ncbi:MAG TPA: FixH family protein [Polyangiaceae bacterium]|jgi:hypothetical protein|nr:FixH family protein [Polyangiaceae bacterium]
MKPTIFVAVAGLGLACADCSSGSAATATFPDAPFISTMTDSGNIRVELRTSPQPPARGTIDAQLVVTNAADGTPRDDLALSILPWMPAMNHGAIHPTITPQGDGKYLITELDLYMPGHWQLRTTISGPVTDSVAPAFDIP